LIINELEVAPLILAPFFRHWNESASGLVAVTLKEAGKPAQADWFAGCPVMVGG
jgi:hypothetical protein